MLECVSDIKPQGTIVDIIDVEHQISDNNSQLMAWNIVYDIIDGC